MNAGLFNALGRGIDLRLMADRGHTPPGQSYIGRIVRADLADEMRDWGDLRAAASACPSRARIST
ncbi:MAG TPA: hypothetical protein VII06_07760 [Chloroflexota bacterium]|jgi:NitT/TauT family transport system substrate-binding protein